MDGFDAIGPRDLLASAAGVTVVRHERNYQFEAAQRALRNGDFAEYGRRIKQLEDTLAKLRAATGQ